MAGASDVVVEPLQAHMQLVVQPVGFRDRLMHPATTLSLVDHIRARSVAAALNPSWPSRFGEDTEFRVTLW